MNPLLAIFGTGGIEWLIVLAVMLLLFGHRLPGLMRSLGQGITEFKKGIRDDTPDDSPRITQDS